MLVIDLSADVAGRFCAKLLAMGGAEVRGPRRGSTWIDRYLGAHSRALDAPATHIGEADVVLTSFDAGRYHDGFDDGLVRSLNPGVVHVTTSTFGTAGPYAVYRGGSIVDWAAGGYLGITGEPDREPLRVPSRCAGTSPGTPPRSRQKPGWPTAGRTASVCTPTSASWSQC
jgi:crotonobetainyl-CoA:carnitine CoA-transferase CaiB-like acyl-CoA transferase